MLILDRLDALMKEHGWKAPYVCEQIGVSRYVISDWKRGRYSPSQEQIEALAKLFGVTIDYLMGKTDTKNPATNNSDGISKNALLFEQILKEEGLDRDNLSESFIRSVISALKTFSEGDS